MILVTGGSGYLGTVLIDKLIESDFEVRAVDIGWFSDGWNYLFDKTVQSKIANKDELQLYRGDFRNCDATIFDNVDAVCHLAGLSNDPMAEFNPAANHAINGLGAVEFAKKAKENGVSVFIFASTASVYDGMDRHMSKWEDANLDIKYPYTASKLYAEKELSDLADENFQVVILRQATLWGISHRMRFDLVVNTMARDAATTKRINIVIQKEEKYHCRPLCHVEDCADIYVAILNGEVLVNTDDNVHRYNVIGENIEIFEVGQYIRDVFRRRHHYYIMSDYIVADKVRSYTVKLDYRLDKYMTHIIQDEKNINLNSLSDYIVSKSHNELYYPISRNIDWLKTLSTCALITNGNPPLPIE